MRFQYIFLLCLIYFLPAYSQNAIGEWQTYLSYHNPTRSEVNSSFLPMVIYMLMIKKIPAYELIQNLFR